MEDRRRSWWGWGWEDHAITLPQLSQMAAPIAQRLGVRDLKIRTAPPLASLELPPPRVVPPDALASICSSSVYDRAGHTSGKSFTDIVRAVHGEVEHPPDVVALPTDEPYLVAVLDWCAETRMAAVP